MMEKVLLSSRLYCRLWSCTISAVRLADFTAGQEFHHALKKSSVNITIYTADRKNANAGA